jgi:hypothetical protein
MAVHIDRFDKWLSLFSFEINFNQVQLGISLPPYIVIEEYRFKIRFTNIKNTIVNCAGPLDLAKSNEKTD